MAVTSIKEIGPGRSGDSQGPHDSSIVRVWRVITDNPFDSPLTIQPSMPVDYGTPLAGTGMVCQAVSYDFQEKGPSLSVWTASFTFRSTAIDQEVLDRQQFPNPLDRRARVTVRSVRYGELRNTDKNGDIKRTSAGEIYEEKEVDATRWTIHVRKNYLTIPDYIWTYQDKLNAAPVTVKGRVLEKEAVKFGEVVVPELVKENGVEYYPIEFDLDYREPGPDGTPWKDRRVDAGFYYIDAADSNKLKRILDGDGDPTVIAEYLDGSGGRLRDIIANPAPGDETINEFDDYETADFSILPLNES